MKAFITKYALSSGIEEVNGEVSSFNPNLLMVLNQSHVIHNGYFHGQGREWHLTSDAAIKKAESMRTAKIASHEASIAKLKALKFQ